MGDLEECEKERQLLLDVLSLFGGAAVALLLPETVFLRGAVLIARYFERVPAVARWVTQMDAAIARLGRTREAIDALSLEIRAFLGRG